MLLLQLYPSHITYNFSLSIPLLLRKLLCLCVNIKARTPKSQVLLKKTVKMFKNYGSNIYTDDGDNFALKTQQTTWDSCYS
jgi:hypothetical protein